MRCNRDVIVSQPTHMFSVYSTTVLHFPTTNSTTHMFSVYSTTVLHFPPPTERTHMFRVFISPPSSISHHRQSELMCSECLFHHRAPFPTTNSANSYVQSVYSTTVLHFPTTNSTRKACVLHCSDGVVLSSLRVSQQMPLRLPDALIYCRCPVQIIDENNTLKKCNARFYQL